MARPSQHFRVQRIGQVLADMVDDSVDATKVDLFRGRRAHAGCYPITSRGAHTRACSPLRADQGRHGARLSVGYIG